VLVGVWVESTEEHDVYGQPGAVLFDIMVVNTQTLREGGTI
jgi:hypothetical protein